MVHKRPESEVTSLGQRNGLMSRGKGPNVSDLCEKSLAARCVQENERGLKFGPNLKKTLMMIQKWILMEP